MPPLFHRTPRRSGPRPARATAGLLALLLPVAGLSAAGASAAPTTAPDTGTESREPRTADTTEASAATETEAGSYDLTLVTGDTVHVTVDADGRQRAEVSPAPRPDGSSPGFWTHRRGDDLYVIPQDVADLVPRRLDPALFNVSGLIENGHTDTQSDDLEVIVTYRSRARLRTQAAPGSGDVRQLESVNGLGLHIDKEDDTAAIRRALHRLADRPKARTLSSGPYAGLDKIWLDRRIEPALDESTAQVGAPSAWEQGYDGSGVTVAVLDTGIDTDHPDLAENVVASRNFTDSDTADDRRGHGTHVASTVAGSGAASDGRYTGVAPGADLLNGKVLNDAGTGSTSQMIDGMEWAAKQGADIVNMSIGIRGGYTDGTDPGSVAVDALTEQYGTLFVVAAGNDGPSDSTVTTPATADRALTVGAVDKDGDIAEFSSRGPRAGDRALKPDVTAPGVHIGAARADGTALCEFVCSQPEDGPINEHYTAASGTSMASPHVAGAAALVAQAHPGLEATQLKSRLMSTASPSDDLSIYAEGAGEVDVAAALTAPLLTAPTSVSLGNFRYPHAQRDPVERTITYTNPGDEARTVELAIDVENGDGEPAPEGALTLSERTLTVPAGGSATATLTLDTTLPGFGQFGGALVARTADGDSLRTPVGYYKEPERYDLHVKGIARDGREAYGRFSVLDVVDGSVAAKRAWGKDNETTCTTEQRARTNCIRVPPGTYSISGLIATLPQWAPAGQVPGPLADYLNTSLVSEPEVTIDSDTTLTLDARDAVEVEIETPDHETKRNDGAARYLSLTRTPENGPAIGDGLLINPRTQLQERLFVQPTEQVTQGQLAAYTQWGLAAPAITFDVAGSDSVPLNPMYYDRAWFSDNSRQYPMLDGTHELPVVDAGTATADEIDGLDLDGALALVRRSDAVPVPEQSGNAAEAGAAMVAIYNDVPGSNADPGVPGDLQVPTVRLSHAEGTGLLDLLQKQQVTVEAVGQPVSPYQYNLTYTEKGRIPQDLHYVADTDELAAVENSFHSQLGEEFTFTETWFALQPWEDFSLSFGFPTRGGAQTRTDYYVPSSETEYLRTVTTPESVRWPEPEIILRGEQRSFQPGERVQQSWFNAPLRPGLWSEDPVRRSGDEMSFNFAAVTDGDGHVAGASTTPEHGPPGFTTRFRVYADDQKVIETSGATDGIAAVPPDAENFRLEYDVQNAASWAKLSPRTRSVWTFTSSTPADGQVRVEPLLTVDYDVDVDLHNRVPAPEGSTGPHALEFTVGHQAGAPDLPIRSTASLEVSYDSGESWSRVRNLREVEDGRFVAHLPRKGPENTAGTVSLRIEAEDRAGNTVEQEIIDAYGLSGR
ncbi:subtilisin family serine protease [Haloactinopolyspora alba]|uniref:Subtilisin family serine protease n=1 Tax=Haloactinopolyspora alba TaxID=648780 RepID=A0A2P8DWR2_9ACTN|nr:S8 family serine peptidase [Haloactinopolyspora alba]PSL01644.1 subtilisin family serine protease [Haloactinopolyspora alba]